MNMNDKLSSKDFNVVVSDSNDQFVRISELNQMIKYGAIQIDRNKMREYKFDTTVKYDKQKHDREHIMKIWEFII